MTGFWSYGWVIGRIDPWIELISKEKQQSDLTDGHDPVYGTVFGVL
jgi:hypothetical protein